MRGERRGERVARGTHRGRARRLAQAFAAAALLESLHPAEILTRRGATLPGQKHARLVRRCTGAQLIRDVVADAGARARVHAGVGRHRVHVGCCIGRGCCAFASITPVEPSSDRLGSPTSRFDGDGVIQRRAATAPRSTSTSARSGASRILLSRPRSRLRGPSPLQFAGSKTCTSAGLTLAL